MKTRGSLACSQQLAAGPYPESDTFSPHLNEQFPQDPYRRLGFHTKILYIFIISP
jgi:hypothetical protein